jgi:putative lipoic acid-binding regulatory protein
MAVKSRSKTSRPAPFLRLAYSAPTLQESVQQESTLQESTVAEVHHRALPATKALPFVKLRANDQPTWHPESFWRVQPTGKREADIRLGRKFACQAIGAMKADRNSRLIAYIVQDIINDVAQRTRKSERGRYRAIVLGFLMGISEALAAAS